MTKEDWKKVEGDWLQLYTSVKLKCDGYELTVQTERNKNRLIGVVYVDGWMKSEYLEPLEDDKRIGTEEPEWHEIGRRFYRTSQKQLYKNKDIADMKKIWGKKKTAEMKATKYFSKDLHWTSFNSFKRHILKHNKSIELIKEDE